MDKFAVSSSAIIIGDIFLPIPPGMFIFTCRNRTVRIWISDYRPHQPGVNMQFVPEFRSRGNGEMPTEHFLHFRLHINGHRHSIRLSMFNCGQYSFS